MRAVPLIDLTGLEALASLHGKMHHAGGTLLFSGLQPDVQRMLERGGLYDQIGADKFFWGSEEAILAAEGRYPCALCSSASSQALSASPPA